MFFEKAKSVWLKNLAGTTNIQGRFECEFFADKDKEYTVNITAQTFYRCYDLWNFLKNYRNNDGLLENLPGWNFIEWSQANDWMQGVHYPTNMLYSSMLRIIADIYDDPEAANEANIVKGKVMEQSFDGKLFIDNAVRNKAGKLVVTSNYSEACQYYAYFLGFCL